MTVGTREVSMEQIAALCRKWRINRLSLLRSALTGDLRPDSDIDLLAEFDPDDQWSLMDVVRPKRSSPVSLDAAWIWSTGAGCSGVPTGFGAAHDPRFGGGDLCRIILCPLCST